MSLRVCSALWATAIALAPFSAQAAGGSSWKTASDALALGLGATAMVATWVADDDSGREQLVYSGVTTVAATQALKSAIPSWRPDHADRKSFPSGHTAVAFAAASFIDTRYQPAPATRAALYSLAALTGVARVRADKHHWRDVVAGAALGWGASHYWTSPRSGVRVSLVPRGDGAALALFAHF